MMRANWSTAEVRCVCGLTIRVERDECGASAPTFPCQRDGCGRQTCEHESVECGECLSRICSGCSAKYGGRVLCVVCLTAEIADGAAELAEVAA